MDLNEKSLSSLYNTNERQHLTRPGAEMGWSPYLVAAGIAVTIGAALPVGYNIGVVNIPAQVMKKFSNESLISRYDIHLNETWLNLLWSFIVSIFIVGGCIGSILGSDLANRLGRKRATVFTSLLFLCGALLFLICRYLNSVEILVLGRLIAGLSAGLATSIVPMYLTELSPPNLTGAVGVFCPMGVNIGVLVSQVMGLDFLLGGKQDWPYLLAAYSLLIVICLPVLLLLPESPKYLYVIKMNETNTMRAELCRLRGLPSSLLSEDLHCLNEERRASSAARDGWGMMRVLRDPKLRLPLLLACTMQAGQQTSGINAVFYYSQEIFTEAGLHRLEAQYATIGCGVTNVLAAVAVIRLLRTCGRRPLLLTSLFSAAVLLAALAVAILFMDFAKWMSYVCIAAVVSYVLVYGLGLGPIPYFIASELFEVAPRPAGMAWGSLANWAGNFIVAMTFPTLNDAIGPYSFLIFSAITVLLFLFHRKYFPETRGKSPSQVSELCARGLRSRPLRARAYDVTA